MIYSLIHNPFFLNALIAAVLAAVLCSMIGTYVVTRRMVIMGGGMAHASLGGVGLGAYFGFSPLLGAAAFCLLSGFGIRRLSRLGGEREDAAVAMLWTLGMSVGIVFAGLTPGFVTDLNAYLFGDILAVGQTDLVMLGTLTVLALLFFGFLGRRIAVGVPAAGAHPVFRPPHRPRSVRRRLCPNARPARAAYRGRARGVHGLDDRWLPAHRRHRHGDFPFVCATGHSRALRPHVPLDDLAERADGRGGLPRRHGGFVLGRPALRRNDCADHDCRLFYGKGNKTPFSKFIYIILSTSPK